MNIKDLFDSAENQTLTYDQFVAASQNAKFVDLTDGGYVARQKYTDELNERDTRITALDEAVKTRDTDLNALREQLQSAGTDSVKLGEVTTNLANLQKQYDKDTKALQKQLQEQAYKHAVMDFANQQKFSSQAAKRDFVNSMTAKKLQMEGDTIIGASDFVAAYTKDNEDAFRVESPAQEEKPKPHFSGNTSTGSNSDATSNPFQFHFTGVRPH